MKRRVTLLFALMFLLFVFPLEIWSQTAYARLEDGVLTFLYDSDDKTSFSAIEWEIPEHSYDIIGWQGHDIYEVEFDPSFADARPKVCNSWFSDCAYLWRISGMQYLNTSETTNMASMFYNCSLLQEIDLTDFETYNVTDMSSMFSGCSKLESLDLSTFNTVDVQKMQSMFSGCAKLKNIVFGSLFLTKNTTNMMSMFYGCNNLKRIDLSFFNTSKVTNMSRMFQNCTNLYSLDLSSFNTSQVTTMQGMFSGCSNINRIDLHSFSTSNVTSTKEMFNNCSSLEIIICDGDWNGISESTNMFSGCTNLAGAISYNSSKVTAAYANKATGYFSQFYYYIAEVSNDHNTLTFRRSETAPNRTTQWDATKSGYEEIDTSDDDYFQPLYTFHGYIVSKVVFEESFKDARPNSCYSWFNGNYALTEIQGIENFNTSEVTNMAYMFYGCSNLKSIDLRNFDVTNMEKTNYMFYGCSKLETVVCNDDWYNDQINDSYMFNGCTKLKGARTYTYSDRGLEYANPTTGYFTSTANYKVDLTVPSYGICTYCSTYDLDFINVKGLTAYVISDFNSDEGTLTLTPVTTVQAGVGLLIKGDAGEYVVPRTTTDATYTNYLVAVPTTTSISPTDGNYTNFVFSNGINFYALSKEENISAGEAYLQLPTVSINQENLSRGFTILNDAKEKCAIPIIVFENGKLNFNCETEGVEYHYTIQAEPISNTGNNVIVDFPQTALVSVYATKEGYEDSDVATKEIDIHSLKGDVNDDGKVTVTDAVEVMDIILMNESK